jgi:L-fucose mutarotase
MLHEMGHGDEIVLADANFPGAGIAKRLLRADGISIVELLKAIMPLFPLDQYSDSLIMMQTVNGDTLDPLVEIDYLNVVRGSEVNAPIPVRIERYAYYERAARAYGVLMTGESRIYANLILKKGVIGAA